MKTNARVYAYGDHEIEVGVVEHNGREFSALGSVIHLDAGYVSGYVTKDAATGRWYLASWGGEFMFVELRLRSVWTQRSRWGLRTDMFAWRATINNQMYLGRNAGQGMLLHLRAKKVKGS